MIAGHIGTTQSALLDLARRDGSITPESVVEAATDPASPLHNHFTWDDTEAARRYRLVEAGHLIRRYRIVVETAPDRKVKVRAFSSVPVGDDLGYVPTVEAMADPERREFVVQQAMREVAALRAKYQALIDFDEVLRSSIGQKTTRRRKAS